VVCHDNDHRVVKDTLCLEFLHYLSYVMVKPGDLVVITCQIFPCDSVIDKKYRRDNIIWVIDMWQGILIPKITVRIVRRKPHEKRLIFWPFFQIRHPLFGTAPASTISA